MHFAGYKAAAPMALFLLGCTWAAVYLYGYGRCLNDNRLPDGLAVGYGEHAQLTSTGVLTDSHRAPSNGCCVQIHSSLIRLVDGQPALSGCLELGHTYTLLSGNRLIGQHPPHLGVWVAFI